MIQALAHKAYNKIKRCNFLTYEDIDKFMTSLVKNIEDSKCDFDLLVEIASGGGYPSERLSEKFRVKPVSMDISHYWVAINSKKIKVPGVLWLAKHLGYKPKARIERDVEERDIIGKKILIVDEDSYSGETLKAALESINQKKPVYAKTAVLYTHDKNKLVDFSGYNFKEKDLYELNLRAPWSISAKYHNYNHGKKLSIVVPNLELVVSQA